MSLIDTFSYHANMLKAISMVLVIIHYAENRRGEQKNIRRVFTASIMHAKDIIFFIKTTGDNL